MHLKAAMVPSVEALTWFKDAVSVTYSDGPETYRSRCIGRVSADT